MKLWSNRYQVRCNCVCWNGKNFAKCQSKPPEHVLPSRSKISGKKSPKSARFLWPFTRIKRLSTSLQWPRYPRQGLPQATALFIWRWHYALYPPSTYPHTPSSLGAPSIPTRINVAKVTEPCKLWRCYATSYCYWLVSNDFSLIVHNLTNHLVQLTRTELRSNLVKSRTWSWTALSRQYTAFAVVYLDKGPARWNSGRSRRIQTSIEGKRRLRARIMAGEAALISVSCLVLHRMNIDWIICITVLTEELFSENSFLRKRVYQPTQGMYSCINNRSLRCLIICSVLWWIASHRQHNCSSQCTKSKQRAYIQSWSSLDPPTRWPGIRGWQINASNSRLV